jgi:uncharacterized RDD family membrane protein YckC
MQAQGDVFMNPSMSVPSFDYASFGRRFLAFILDAMILAIPCMIANHIIPIVGSIAVAFFYGPILESSDLQATLGKHLMGIQVVDLQGRRISLQASLIRNVIKIFSTGILFLGYFFALFTQRHQALHDMLADTVIIYGRNDRPVADAWMDKTKEVFRGIGTTGGDRISKLERLQALREKGTITEEEFLAQKKAILES